MKRPVKIIVVGGNAAGPAAAAKARRVNPNADVLLFEASEFISTGTCEIPYVLSGEIKDIDKIIFYSPASFQQEKGVKVYVKHLVKEIDTKKKVVVVHNLIDDKIIEEEYDRLILATGSKAKSLPGFDTQIQNIFTLKNINDLKRIYDYLKTNKEEKAVIIGSGFIGLETAEALVKRNIKIKLIESYSRPLPSSDKDFSEEILKTIEKNKVEFLGDVKDLEPVITNDKLIAVKTAKKFIETDLVLVCIGFEPDNYLARSAQLELGKSGAIKVDQYLKTSDRFIFAAGDNVEIINSVTNKPEYLPLATHSYDLGHIAGANAAGKNLRYDPIVKNMSVKIFDKYFAQVGLTSEEANQNKIQFSGNFAKARNLVKVMPGSDYVQGDILVEKNSKRIIGASFLGGNEVSGYADLISALIKLKIPVTMLSKINYNYTPPLSPFINLLKIIGKNIY